METEKFCITIADLPDRENLVAEITYENVQWAEISKENEEVIIHFYTHPRNRYWEFPLEEALTILEKAKKRFLEMQIIRE